MPEPEYLTLSVTGPVATIVVDRPDRMNALDGGALRRLGELVEKVEAEPTIRAAVITGAGDRAFVAGADINELQGLSVLRGVELSRLGQAVFGSIERSRKVWIAAVNGFALGGGCELALACHLRLASANAKFGLPEVKLGLIPGYGGTVRLSRIVGRGRALEMILSGDMIDADAALRMGLVNRLCEAGTLLDESHALADRIARNSPVAVGFAVEAVTRASDLPTEDALAMEAHLFGLLAATEDMREGVEAFLQKRQPDFPGR